MHVTVTTRRSPDSPATGRHADHCSHKPSAGTILSSGGAASVVASHLSAVRRIDPPTTKYIGGNPKTAASLRRDRVARNMMQRLWPEECLRMINYLNRHRPCGWTDPVADRRFEGGWVLAIDVDQGSDHKVRSFSDADA